MAEWWEALAGAGVSAGVKLAEKAVERIFAPKRTDPEPTLMSPGLAVGYYYNFIDLMAKQLSFGGVTLATGTGEAATKTTFDLDATNLQIIVPQRLDGAAFQRCAADFDATQKGAIFIDAQKRTYGVNYIIIDLGARKRLTIVDYARPVISLKRFYEDVGKIDTAGDDPRWRELQKAEITAFAQTLERLQKRGYAELTNKLDIVYRG